MISLLIGAVIGAGLTVIADNYRSQKDCAAVTATVSDTVPANEYGSYDTYDTYDYGGIDTCTDAIVLPGHLFCKEDQEIATLAKQLKQANASFVDPRKSVLFRW